MAWRAMTNEELATRSEARLQGSLLLIVVCAAVLAVACVISLLFALVAMPTMLMAGLFALRGPAALGVLYGVPSLYLMVWAVAFLILTLTRSPLAPGFAANGLVGWLGVRLVISVIGQFWIAGQYSGGPAFLLQSLVPMLLNLLGELMLVAGFWVYMRDGARPNGYYRRLVQA